MAVRRGLAHPTGRLQGPRRLSVISCDFLLVIHGALDLDTGEVLGEVFQREFCTTSSWAKSDETYMVSMNGDARIQLGHDM